MEDILPIVIVIGFFALIIGYSIYENKKNKERQATIKRYAEMNGLTYKQEVTGFPVEYEFKMNSTGHSHLYEALLMGERNGISFCTFDFAYTTGSGKNSQRHIHTVCLLSSNESDFPDFFAREESKFWDGLGKLFGGQDINFSEDKSYSDKFVLQGPSENAIRRYFSSKVRSTFVRKHQPGYVYEAHGDTLAIQANGFMKPDERVRFLANGIAIFKGICSETNNTLG